MTPKALKALQQSIRKWERIVLGTGQDAGTGNCALCAAFYEKKCRGCPVSKATGMRLCLGTPYRDYIDNERARSHPADAEGLFHARRMLDFLRGLLPKRLAVKHYEMDAP